MTTHQSVTSSTTAISTPPAWVRVLLGVVLILAGIFVLGDVALATIVSTMFIGYTAIVAGAFEIIHAFWTKGWGGFIWQIVLGILYIAFGRDGGEPAGLRGFDLDLRSWASFWLRRGSFELFGVSAIGGDPAGSWSCPDYSDVWPASLSWSDGP